MTPIPRPQPRPRSPEARAFRNGDMVILPNGRLSVLRDVRAFEQSVVQMGTVREHYFWKDLEVANISHIIKMNMTGVECNQTPAVRAALKRGTW